jgi:hypothetical protein
MATNYYLVIHGVAGNYSDTLLTGAFKVSDFEFLTQNSGKSTFNPLTLTLNSDSYTALLTDLGKGTVIGGVSLIGETNGPGGTPQITYDLNLSNVVVTDLLKDNTSTTGVDLTLDYNKIGLVTNGIGPTGKLQTPQSFRLGHHAKCGDRLRHRTDLGGPRGRGRDPAGHLLSPDRRFQWRLARQKPPGLVRDQQLRNRCQQQLQHPRWSKWRRPSRLRRSLGYHRA